MFYKKSLKSLPENFRDYTIIKNNIFNKIKIRSEFQHLPQEKLLDIYWPKVAKLLGLPLDSVGVIKYFTLAEFEKESIGMIKACLYKLKVSGEITSEDEMSVKNRLNVVREARRLQSKFKEIYIVDYYSSLGESIQSEDLKSIRLYDSKGESYSLIAFAEDKVFFGKEMKGGWRIFFGDGNIPEEIKLDINVKFDEKGNFYVFPVNDISGLVGPENIRRIKALVSGETN